MTYFYTYQLWCVFTVPPPPNFVIGWNRARLSLAHFGRTALARLTRARILGADGVDPSERRRCFASCVVGPRYGEGTDRGDGADFCEDFGDINLLQLRRSDSCGGNSRRHEAAHLRCHLGREDIATRFDVRAEFVRLSVGSDCRSETCRRREAPVRRRCADRRFEQRSGLYSLRMCERPRSGNEHSPGDGPAFERRSGQLARANVENRQN